jgi:hypothetical protein
VWITVPGAPKQPEPADRGELKTEVINRWGMVSLLDVLKEAGWLTGFHRTLLARKGWKMNDEPSAIMAAALIINTESALATLEKALLAGIKPLLEDTVEQLSQRVAAMDERLTRLESPGTS